MTSCPMLHVTAAVRARPAAGGRSWLRHECLALRGAVAEAIHHTARRQKTATTTHDHPRQIKGDVEVAETISQERISKPMVEHIVDKSVPQEHSSFLPPIKEGIVPVMECTPQEHMRVPTIMEGLVGVELFLPQEWGQ